MPSLEPRRQKNKSAGGKTPVVKPHSSRPFWRWVLSGTILFAIALMLFWVAFPHSSVRPAPPPAPQVERLASDQPISGLAALATEDAYFSEPMQTASSPTGVPILQNHLIRLHLASGTWADMTQGIGFDIEDVALSREGDIAFSQRDGGGIWNMENGGGGLRRISAEGFSPDFSPDHRFVVYATGSGHEPLHRRVLSSLKVIDLTSMRSRELFDGDAIQPRFSPTGRRIFFARSVGGFKDICSIPFKTAGKVPVCITNDVQADWSPCWSPDGRYLYFIRDGAVFRVRVDEDSGIPLESPSPAAPGLAGVAELATTTAGIIVVQRAKPVRLEKIILPTGLARQADAEPVEVVTGLVTPDLSRDGTILAGRTEGTPERVVISKLGKTEWKVTLTLGPGSNRGPRISPNGDLIAIHSNANGTRHFQVFVMKIDGTGARQITFENADVTTPVWRNDGQELAVFIKDEGPAVVELANGRLKRLPNPSSLLRFVPSGWSHDGRIVGHALREDGTSAGIYVLNRSQTHYARVRASGWDPQWLSDDRRVAYQFENEIRIVDTVSKAWGLLFRPQSFDVLAGGFRISADETQLVVPVRDERAEFVKIDLP